MRAWCNYSTDSEASELLRLTPRQVLRLAKRGDLPAVYLPGNEIRFDPSDLARWVEAHKRSAPQEATR
ncbi:MAG: helix-turn-helix domain-containing protein [Planctomycetota bacterium]